MRLTVAGTAALAAAAVGAFAFVLPQRAPAADPRPAVRPSAPAVHHPAPAVRHALGAGHSLGAGSTLRSPSGRTVLALRPSGRLVLAVGGRTVWHSTGTGRDPRLVLRPGGDLEVRSGRRVVWSTRTGASGARVLAPTDGGMLRLGSPAGTVWSSVTGNACVAGPRQGKRVLVSLGTQFARLCDHGRQLLTTPITSGMSAYGYGTPTGTWRVQAKVTNTVLHPASGGAYHVRFWMPYDGVYGMHDAPWQKIPFGSPKYRTHGSHGCVHFPRPAIAWMFRWAEVGTTVTIRA